MPYTYTLTATIPASPQEIYETWLDSTGHTEMTGGDAVMSAKIDAEVSAWDGYITGRNLELVPGERIVQSWRTSQFTDDHDDSIITVMLDESDDGETLLTLIHSNVPDGQTSYERGGWQSRYFEPMIDYFTERDLRGAHAAEPDDAPPPRQAAEPLAAKPEPQPAKKVEVRAKAKAKPKAKTKSAAKSAAKSKPKAKRKTKKTKKSKPKAKAKSKAKTKAKSKSKRRR